MTCALIRNRRLRTSSTSNRSIGERSRSRVLNAAWHRAKQSLNVGYGPHSIRRHNALDPARTNLYGDYDRSARFGESRSPRRLEQPPHAEAVSGRVAARCTPRVGSRRAPAHPDATRGGTTSQASTAKDSDSAGCRKFAKRPPSITLPAR